MTGRAEEKRCFALAERLQKLIAAAGLCSRRTAEEWIAAGRVRVNGETATVGQSADPETDMICVDGVPLTPPERRVYLMLNKPRGYVTTLSDEQGELAQMFGIESIPTLAVVQDRHTLTGSVGLRSKEEIKAMLDGCK